jgi:CRP-like cAMP-binding protein
VSLGRPASIVAFMDRAGILLENPIFGDLARKDVEELVPHLRQVMFARGETIWNEGAPATDLYVMAEGQMNSFRISRDGAELILEIASAGDCLGEVGLFHPGGVRLVSFAREREPCPFVFRVQRRSQPERRLLFRARPASAGERG